MRIAIVAFTNRGYALATQLAQAFAAKGDDAALHVPSRLAERTGAAAFERLADWTEQAFGMSDALVFVGAAGIAVRSIAPFVRDKMDDPAVLSIDEAAGYVVPLLSGHVGGANELARRVGRICGAQPVISTATDVNGCFAVDVWAYDQGLALLDRDVAKMVSARLLEGEPVGFASDYDVAGELPDGLVRVQGGAPLPEVGISVSLDARKRPFAHTLRLVPRMVTVGVGCKRGAPAETIGHVIDEALIAAGIAFDAVGLLATIDVKADEDGLRACAASHGWSLCFYTAAELAAVPGSFSSSLFVRQTVGVGNVCERAACANGGRLLAGRLARDGVTVALATREPQLSFDELAREGRP